MSHAEALLAAAHYPGATKGDREWTSVKRTAWGALGPPTRPMVLYTELWLNDASPAAPVLGPENSTLT